MCEISVEKYTDAKAYTMTVGNRRLHDCMMCMMHDVQEGLGF